jgi:hypothetical protein
MCRNYSPGEGKGTCGFARDEGGTVAGIDLIDETFVAVAPPALVARLTAGELWQQWFPDLRREVFMDRAEKGVRWSVTGQASGSVEVWLEEVPRGTLVHWYVRLDALSNRDAQRLTAQYRRAINEGMFEVKDDAEAADRGQ